MSVMKKVSQRAWKQNETQNLVLTKVTLVLWFKSKLFQYDTAFSLSFTSEHTLNDSCTLKVE